ncbi:MAG: hypothetical protein EXQ85_04110 [Alphaproteobacteria bacterium]|nr:hypothetical protein [Alphaproteobacteria bacterium]
MNKNDQADPKGKFSLRRLIDVRLRAAAPAERPKAEGVATYDDYWQYRNARPTGFVAAKKG